MFLYKQIPNNGLASLLDAVQL